MLVKINVDTYEYAVREPDPNDKWDAGDWDEDITSISAVSTEDEWDAFLVPVEPGDKIYAVIVRYSTGDTFGHYDGKHQIMDVFADYETASKLVKVLEQHDLGKDHRYYKWEVEFNGNKYYPSWLGYFEQLRSIDVHELVVDKSVIRW